MQGIKNIIFDLGGVIINLDVNKTISEFSALINQPFEKLYTQKEQNELFNLLDKGAISPDTFFNELKKITSYNGSIEKMQNAWNAMLQDVPEHRLDTLVTMKHNYNTFLLSNTCEPHIEAFEKELEDTYGIKNFDDYFDKVYYSCRIGMRKPDREIFEHVLRENHLKASETIFIDDSPQHVKGAGECGINAFLLEKNREVKDLLKELHLL